MNTNEAYDTWIAMYMYVIFLHNMPLFDVYAGITKERTSIGPFDHIIRNLYKILCKKRIERNPRMPVVPTMYTILHIDFIQKKQESLYVQGFLERICYR